MIKLFKTNFSKLFIDIPNTALKYVIIKNANATKIF